MSISTNKNILYLSQEGDSMEITNLLGHNLPEKNLIAAYNTHELVLKFLKTLQGDEYQFHHYDNSSYERHKGTFPKGVAHPCTLEDQIKFVEFKILEKEQGALQSREICIIQ